MARPVFDAYLSSESFHYALQGVREGRANAIVKGAPLVVVGSSAAETLSDSVAELRASMSENVTTPDAVAQVAVENWLVNAEQWLWSRQCVTAVT